MTAQDWMVVGRVAGVFGVRGELKIEPYVDEPGRFSQLESVYLQPGGEEFGLERARHQRNLVIAKLEGIDSPEQASRLIDREVAIPRSEARELDPGEYFLEDLLGVQVVTRSGEVLGTVGDILRTGANDVFVVGSGRDALLVPATKEAVLDLDQQRRTIVIDDWVLQPYL